MLLNGFTSLLSLEMILLMFGGVIVGIIFGAIPGLCGFGCDSTLDVLFRRRTGLSMRAWRKQHSWRT